MDKYEIALSRDKRYKSFGMLGWLIISLNYFVLIYLSIVRPSSITTGTMVITLTILLAYGFTRKNKNSLTKMIFLPAWFITIPIWVLFGFPWLAVANAVLLALAILVSKKLIIRFGKEFISYPSFPIRELLWTELDNVILKDGILTIDFRDNKLLQHDIDESNFPVNEKEFNDFCKAQLKK